MTKKSQKKTTTGKPNGFIVFDDYYDHFKELPAKDIKELMLALFEYHISGKETNLSLAPKMVFQSIKQNIDRNSLKYLETCQRNKENIEKRWAKHKSGNTTVYDRIPSDTKHTNKDKDKDNNNTYSQLFDKFWTEYQRKGSKAKAYEQWKKMTEPDRLDAITAIPIYFMENPDAQFRKDAERYLSHKVFEACLERKKNNQQIVKQKSVFGTVII